MPGQGLMFGQKMWLTHFHPLKDITSVVERYGNETEMIMGVVEAHLGKQQCIIEELLIDLYNSMPQPHRYSLSLPRIRRAKSQQMFQVLDKLSRNKTDPSDVATTSFESPFYGEFTYPLYIRECHLSTGKCVLDEPRSPFLHVAWARCPGIEPVHESTRVVPQ